MKYALRARFGRDIIAQFMAPSRPSRRPKVIILCDGMPTLPSKQPLLEFVAAHGYWVFHPRYRGTWESGGSFLAESPDRDIGVVIDHLTKGFRDAWSGTTYRLTNPDITLIGSSFGGATALLAGRDPRVARVIAISPLVDWTARSKDEPMEFLARFTAEAFGQGYRGNPSVWGKLKRGTFFNPVRHVSEIDGSRVLIMHAQDDRTILYRPVVRFAKQIGATMVLRASGGHMGLTAVSKPVLWKRISRFITLNP